jgi:hypothetical protein
MNKIAKELLQQNVPATGKKQKLKKYFSFSQRLIDSNNLRIHLAETSLLHDSHPPKPLRF